MVIQHPHKCGQMQDVFFCIFFLLLVQRVVKHLCPGSQYYVASSVSYKPLLANIGTGEHVLENSDKIAIFKLGKSCDNLRSSLDKLIY